MIAAIKKVSLTDTPRRPVRFDDYGNLTFTVYIRKVVKENGKLLNSTIQKLPDVASLLALQSEKVPRTAGVL